MPDALIQSSICDAGRRHKRERTQHHNEQTSTEIERQRLITLTTRVENLDLRRAMRRTGLWLIAAILTLILGACTDTPEFRRYHPMVSICGTSVERPPSGDLAQDMVGDWRTMGPGDHPLAGLGRGDRVYRFRPDGTGHYWYAYESPGDQGAEKGPSTGAWKTAIWS